MKTIDLSAIDLNLLAAFEALLEARSVTRAAHRLHLGQPAISAALGRLRSLFEDELLIRLGKTMQLTIPYFKSILWVLHVKDIRR